ncbi:MULTISPECIES: LysR substrate-binding domain-containing protein [unclassified Caballeronia]|uniref:LysR substrate-binding domain-containing protein n=1 Tax=unclassified Caballeronia TaxID=2646786 RepID=UPI00285CAA64|nr:MULTISPECIES: LysR substrate-binding domain-containing protein [unclassified Caballeronia]MDR5814113.1 LysR substrate-binding domain-containing protein [Caballeronia sp. LZ033]MDR5825582.1 LysR substrate-binding domain-containing protein [Caballeronia sp. LZ043]MDR5878658.1 LysR substrate-binding domain-containing protein [Caballeronia sp. LZ032]
MNVRQLEAFQAAMSAGSLTAAAGLLGVSQPAVSQLIAQLESNCGFSLFTRAGTKMRPTREAEVLYAEVQRMFIGVGRVAGVAKALRDQSWGALSIASFPVLTRRVLPGIVTTFCKDRPDVKFSVESMRSNSLLDAIATQQVDLGFSVLPGDRPELNSTYVCTLRGVCILPKGHRLAARRLIRAKDLDGEAFVALGPQDHSRFQIDRIFEEADVQRRIQIEVGQSETACAFVANGMGVAVVDPISVYNNAGADFVVCAFEPKMEFEIWLIRPKIARPFALIETFAAYASGELVRLANESFPDRR